MMDAEKTICEFYSEPEKANVTVMLDRPEAGRMLLHNVDLLVYPEYIEIQCDKQMNLNKIIASDDDDILGMEIDTVEARLYRASDPNNYYRLRAHDLMIYSVANATSLCNGGLRLIPVNDAIQIVHSLNYIREVVDDANSTASDSDDC